MVISPDRPAPRRRPRYRIFRTTFLIPLLLIATIFALFWIMTSEPTPLAGPSRATTHLKYSAVPGFFLQDDAGTDADKFDYTTANFGLIDQRYDTDGGTLAEAAEGLTQWQRFSRKLSSLTATAPAGVTYKLLFLGRHGQGWHNVAEAFYGTRAWDCHYSLLDGSASAGITWADAHLTPLGVAQAQRAGAFWRTQLATQKQPPPQAFYVSPLDRALNTAALTFGGLLGFPAAITAPGGVSQRQLQQLQQQRHSPSFKPIVVKERARETNGLHTCDRRSSAAYITATYPDFELEPGFASDDVLWRADLRETDEALDARVLELLDDIILEQTGDDDDGSVTISITAHGGAIAGMLRVMGHRPFGLQTGGVIPVLLRAERVPGSRRQRDLSWEPLTGCEKDKDWTVAEDGRIGRTHFGSLKEYVEWAESVDADGKMS